MIRTLLHFVPNIRTEPAGAVSGYTWGKPASQSHILNILEHAGFADVRKSLAVQPDDSVAERWLVSDDAALGSQVVDQNDPTNTMPFREWLDGDDDRLLGPQHVEFFGPYLNCVMKQLDTHPEKERGSLSVQVHPKPGHPTRPAKPEMWFGTGQVYFGWKELVTPELIRAACQTSSLESLMNAFSIQPGELLLVPGGTIHAIRYNSFLFEWSMAPGKDDTTKGNLKDATISPYDRTDGKTPRPGKEDIEGSLALLAESDGFKPITKEQSLVTPMQEWADEEGTVRERLFATREVFVHRVHLKSAMSLSLTKLGRGVPLYVNSGSVVVTFGDQSEQLSAGQEVFVPYALGEVTFKALGEKNAEFFFWYAPFPNELAVEGL